MIDKYCRSKGKREDAKGSGEEYKKKTQKVEI